MLNLKLYKSIYLYIALLVYHLGFLFFIYPYVLTNNADAYRYWHLKKEFFSYQFFGTDLIRIINYPLASLLNISYLGGFIIYALIGGITIILLYKIALDYIKPNSYWQFILLIFLFLQPNLHVWTAIIGKEVWLFLALVGIAHSLIQKKYKSWVLWASLLLIILIRPHVAMFLILAVVLTYIIENKKWTTSKLMILLVLVATTILAYNLTIKLLNYPNAWDFSFILQHNNRSLLAFRRADSYLPMIDYNILERFFIFNFYPIFNTNLSLYPNWIISLENLFFIVLILLALILRIVKFNKTKLDSFCLVFILFGSIATLFFTQRYSCVGIFIRTKMMYMPFVGIVCLKIIFKALHTQKNFKN